jgi:hypothetical protein
MEAFDDHTKILIFIRLKAEPGSTDKYHLAWPLLDKDSNWRTGRERKETHPCPYIPLTNYIHKRQRVLFPLETENFLQVNF